MSNLVSFSIDERGRVFVAETHRYLTCAPDMSESFGTIQTRQDIRDLIAFLTAKN